MAVTDLGQVFFVHEHSTNPPPKTNMIWIRPIDVMLGTYDFYKWNGTTWALFEPTVGGVFRGVWNNRVTYKRYDFVRYEQTLYAAKEDNLDKQPDSNLVAWELVLASGSGSGIIIPDLQVRLFNENSVLGVLATKIELFWLPQENTKFLEYTPQIWLYRQKSKSRSQKRHINTNGRQVRYTKKISARFAHPKNSGLHTKLDAGTEYNLPMFPYIEHTDTNNSVFSLHLNHLEWFKSYANSNFRIKGQRNRFGKYARKCEYITFAICITLPDGKKVIGKYSQVIRYSYSKYSVTKFALSFV